MKTIAWDVDDVLNNLMHDWLTKKWKKEHPSCSLQLEDIVENPPERLLGVSREQYIQSLTAFRLSADFQESIPNPQVHEWFKNYGNKFRHIVVTATPPVAASACTAWLIRHYGEWIQTFHFERASKAQFLKWFEKADIFIDDSPRNVTEAAAAGTHSILFSRPWNRGSLKTHELLGALTGYCS